MEPPLLAQQAIELLKSECPEFADVIDSEAVTGWEDPSLYVALGMVVMPWVREYFRSSRNGQAADSDLVERCFRAIDLIARSPSRAVSDVVWHDVLESGRQLRGEEPPIITLSELESVAGPGLQAQISTWRKLTGEAS